MLNIHVKKAKATQQSEIILTGPSSTQDQQPIIATTPMEALKTTEKTAATTTTTATTTSIEPPTTTTTTITTTMEVPVEEVKTSENELKTSVVEQVKNITMEKK